MSYAANPNKPKRDKAETEAAVAAKQERADRERIRRLIITLGDEKKKVVGQIKGLVGALEDDVELHGDLMAETVLDCAKSLPLKTSVFSAWIARMLNARGAWAAGVIGKAMEDFRNALVEGHITHAQLLLRFLVCLGNCGSLPLPSVVALLQEVLALSEGLRPARGGDLGVFMVLAALLWLSPAARAQSVEKVDALIAAAEAYLASREGRWKLVLCVLRSEELPDRLEALAGAVRSLRDAKWSSQAALHVPGFEPSAEGHAEAPTLGPLGLSIDDVKKSKVRLQVPLVANRLVTGSGRLEGEPLAEHDRWLLEDYIITTSEMFSRDVEECSQQILRIPVLHPHFDAIIIETVFSLMLRLPHPLLLPLFYSRLLEALAEKQNTMTQVIEKAYVALFQKTTELDEECLEVLAEAWAYHLMHNSYTADWSPFTGESIAPQSQRFLRRALERLQRLSFHQNLLHRLPEAVHVYVPPEPLAASSLPVQAKPEFARMLGFVRIKEPDTNKVMTYCRRLLRRPAKEEPKEEEDEEAEPKEEDSKQAKAAEVPPSEDHKGSEEAGEAATTAAPPEGAKEGQEEAATADAPPQGTKRSHEEAATADAPPQGTKRSREEAATADAPPQGTKRSHEEAGAEAAAAAEAPPEGPKRCRTEEKQEGQEAEAGTKADGASKAEGDAKAAEAAKEEDDLGEVPAVAWPLESVLELFTVAMLQHGAKTPTHMSKMLDGHQQVFAELQPAEEEEAHSFAGTVVRCVFEFWHLSGQRLEITLDSLLHRGVTSARAVVETALAQRGPMGCDSMPVWHMIHSVVRKSLERSQSVRVELAIAKKLGKNDVSDRCRRQLDMAVQETAELFTVVFTGLVRNYQDFEEKDGPLRKAMLDRVLVIGRKYYAFIKPLIEAAEARIPGVAHNPEIAAVFQSLRQCRNI